LRAADALEARLWIAAAGCALAALALGAALAHRPPLRIDVAAAALRGTAVPVALFFTALGRWPVLLGIGVVATGIAMSLRTGVSSVVVLLAAQVVSQAAAALMKLAFQRVRPDGALGPQESDLSFPSGHSVSAVVFFAGLAVLAWHAPLPRPIATVVSAVLLVCAAGIPWSRLALGAHYLTDVIGGLLVGTAVLCAALAIVARFAPAVHAA
jgi:membrane-associated phospholipid phosphatase